MSQAQNFLTSVNISYGILMIAFVLLVGVVILTSKKR